VADLAEELVRELAIAQAERWKYDALPNAELVRYIAGQVANPNLRADVEFLLAALTARGRLVPEGWRRETEWANGWSNSASTSTWTGPPQYRREHAERERRQDERTMQREIIAGRWAVVPENTPSTEDQADA
jgi:hypothetical protein